MSKRMVEITCEIRRETDKALQLDDGATVAWVPKSMVDYHESTDPRSKAGVAVMPEFLAVEKGFL